MKKHAPPAGPSTYRPAELAEMVRPARLFYYPTLASTNTCAMQLRRDKALFAPALVVAAHQTAGRGRGSNNWWADRGNLTATWVFHAEPQYAPHQLPLIIGLALRGACVELSGDTTIGIKWPNDLLWQGRKLSGILCERADNADFVGIGLNLNLIDSPPQLRGRAVSLATIAGHPFDINHAVGLITQHLRRFLAGRASQPFAAMLQQYQACDALLGRELAAEVPGDPAPLVGTCEGIDRDGALLLRAGPRLHRLIAASITLR